MSPPGWISPPTPKPTSRCPAVQSHSRNHPPPGTLTEPGCGSFFLPPFLFTVRLVISLATDTHSWTTGPRNLHVTSERIANISSSAKAVSGLRREVIVSPVLMNPAQQQRARIQFTKVGWPSGFRVSTGVWSRRSSHMLIPSNTLDTRLPRDPVGGGIFASHCLCIAIFTGPHLLGFLPESIHGAKSN